MPRVKQNRSLLQGRRQPRTILALVLVATVVSVGGYFMAHKSHAAVQTIPVYRLANWITHERLFTTSAAERDNAPVAYPGWVYEGIDFYAVPSSYTGAVPVYRLANWITHERLFTTSQAEVTSALQNYKGWVNEGTAFYAVPSNDAGAMPVYRLANYITHERLFTPSLAEKNNAIANIPGWVDEGIGFYAENPGSPSGLIYMVPATGTVSVGSNLVFQIHEESNGDPINALQANYTYPASQFQCVSVAYGSFGVQAQTTCANGQIQIARGVSGGSPPFTGDYIVAVVTLKALASGTANITPAAGSLLVRSTDNSNILLSITGGSFNLIPCCG